MNGPNPFLWQHPYSPQPVQGGQPTQPQQALGPAQVPHSALLQQALSQSQPAPQSAPELGVDMLSQAMMANTQRQQQAGANTANQQLPGLNSALGDLGISPVAPFTANDTGLRQGGLGGLFDLGRRALSGWSQQ